MRALRLLLALAFAAALGVWVASAGSSRAWPTVALDASRPRPQGDFLVGASEAPSDINPFTTVEAAARLGVLRYTHDALSELDPETAAVRPALAERVEAVADGTLLITLRRDVRFADGTPLTAEDVAFTHACARAGELPASPVHLAAQLVGTLEVESPHTLRARDVAAHWAAAERFATGMPIVSKAFVIATVAADVRAAGREVPAPGTAAFGAALLRLRSGGPGTGPYVRLEAPLEAAGHLDLVQNPHSWRRAVLPSHWNLAGLRLVFLTDAAARVAALRRGELDWSTDGDPRALLQASPDLGARFALHTYDALALAHHMVVWNHRREWLADPEVRRGLTMLFDRAAIAADLCGGAAVPAAAWFKPDHPAHPAGLAPLPFDPTAARTCVERVTGPGHRLTILAAAEQPLHRRILELALPAFRAAGLELAIEVLEFGSLLQRVAARDFDGVVLLKYQDAWVDPWPHFHSSQGGAGGQNWMGFADAECDRLLDAARTERDADVRNGLLRAFARRMHELQPVTLLVHPQVRVLLHRRFQGVRIGPLGLVPAAWWVEPDDVLHR